MKQLCVLACVLFFSRSVLCLTNQEFYEIALAYVTDDGSVEPFDDADIDVESDDNDDVIELQGGPDDEVDIEYLIKKIGFTSDSDTDSNQRVSWWHRHHHHHHHHHKSGKSGCHCQKLGCNCCISKRWKVRVIFKKFKFRLSACIGVSYVPRNKGFRVYFKLNGHKVFNKEISLKHPPSLCYGIPGFKRFAKVCLEIYNVDLRQKRLCARITGKLDLKIKRFKVHLKLGCFRIPLAYEDALSSLQGDKELFTYNEQAPEASEFLQPDDSSQSDVTSDNVTPIFPLIVEVDEDTMSQTVSQENELNNGNVDETENLIIQIVNMEITDAFRRLRKDLVSNPTLFNGNDSESSESTKVEQNLVDDTLRFE